VFDRIVGHAALYATMTIYAHASLDQQHTALRLHGHRLKGTKMDGMMHTGPERRRDVRGGVGAGRFSSSAAM
jgi:hypothetical protein